MVLYNTALIITGAFKGTSRDIKYKEFDLQSLQIKDGLEKNVFSQSNLRIITILP